MTLLSPSGKPATFGGDVSAGLGARKGLNINAFLQGLDAPTPIPGVPAPPPLGAPGQPSERLQIERERNAYKKSAITPRHLGMSGEELTPQNPFSSGFFTPAAQRQGLQGLAPQGDASPLAHHTDASPVNPFVGAFNPHTEGINPAYQPQAAAPQVAPQTPQAPQEQYGPPQSAQPQIPTSPLPSRNSLITGPQPLAHFADGLSGLAPTETPPPLGPNPYAASMFEEPQVPPQGFQGGVVNTPPATPPTNAQLLLQRIRAGQATRNPGSGPIAPVGPTNAYSNIF